MLLRWAKWTVVTALVVSLAGPWALLQSLAWMAMLVEYSREASLADAVSMTFDGQHPCEMCRAIEAGKTAERQEPKANADASRELTLGLPPATFQFAHPAMPPVSTEVGVLPEPRVFAPPAPPPRAG